MAVQYVDLGIVQYSKEDIPLTWTEVVRGIFIQILDYLVLFWGLEAFTGGHYGSFVGSNTQCCFVHMDRRIKGTMTEAQLSDGTGFFCCLT